MHPHALLQFDEACPLEQEPQLVTTLSLLLFDVEDDYPPFTVPERRLRYPIFAREYLLNLLRSEYGKLNGPIFYRDEIFLLEPCECLFSPSIDTSAFLFRTVKVFEEASHLRRDKCDTYHSGDCECPKYDSLNRDPRAARLSFSHNLILHGRRNKVCGGVEKRKRREVKVQRQSDFIKKDPAFIMRGQFVLVELRCYFSRPAGGQFVGFIPRVRSRRASCSLISLSDLRPRLGITSSSPSVN